MSIKFIPKVGAALVILAIVLIFLGVNYVPRIFALTSSQRNTSDSVILTRPNYVDELYPRAIASQLSFAGTDPHDQTVRAIVPQLSFAGTDPHDRTVRAIAQQLSFAGTDPHDRTLRAIVPYISFTGADSREQRTIYPRRK